MVAPSLRGTWRYVLAIASLGAVALAVGDRRAAIVDGEIVRDEETVRDIEASSAVPLKRGATPFRLLVTKSRYRLDVLDGDRLVKTYPVALGFAPEGAKERSGDHKTPEGAYTLLPHHPSPSFGDCFYVCYPSEEDARRGLAHGLIGKREQDAIVASGRAKARPPDGTHLGGLILLHGTKDRSAVGLTRSNWTLGCIAMENSQVLELLAAFEAKDRPILEIRP